MPRRALCFQPHLDPEVPSPDRVLEAQRRSKLGSFAAESLRKADRVPVALLGDRLPFEHLSVERSALMPFLRRVHFQRELLTLVVEGGETVRVLPQEVQYDDPQSFNVHHVNFRRWPRDPARHPIKLKVPIVFINQESHPAIKVGGYTHNMFDKGGLTCFVSDVNHIPRFLAADMRRIANIENVKRRADFYAEHLDIPPGVRVKNHSLTTQNGGNFLVGRVKRIRG